MNHKTLEVWCSLLGLQPNAPLAAASNDQWTSVAMATNPAAQPTSRAVRSARQDKQYKLGLKQPNLLPYKTPEQQYRCCQGGPECNVTNALCTT